MDVIEVLVIVALLLVLPVIIGHALAAGMMDDYDER